jgi:hypothetical protein
MELLIDDYDAPQNMVHKAWVYAQMRVEPTPYKPPKPPKPPTPPSPPQHLSDIHPQLIEGICRMLSATLGAMLGSMMGSMMGVYWFCR